MEVIALNKTGQIYKGNKIVSSPVFRFLSSIIELDTEFTLLSFFKMIRNYPELIQLSDLLNTLLDMAEQSEEFSVKTDEIDHLLFYKTISMKGFPGEPGIDIYNSLKGQKNDSMLGLKFFQIENLLGHKIVLGNLKHIIFGDGQDTFLYQTFYTLFELIEGITWELSFNFNPKQCVLRR